MNVNNGIKLIFMCLSFFSGLLIASGQREFFKATIHDDGKEYTFQRDEAWKLVGRVNSYDSRCVDKVNWFTQAIDGGVKDPSILPSSLCVIIAAVRASEQEYNQLHGGNEHNPRCQSTFITQPQGGMMWSRVTFCTNCATLNLVCPKLIACGVSGEKQRSAIETAKKSEFSNKLNL